jgi:uncharacterized tellurite resistance protein B-like protein
LIKKLTHYLSSLLKVEVDEQHLDPRIAIASLLCAVGYADHETSDAERLAIKNSLIKLLVIDEQEAIKIMQVAEQEMLQSNSIFDFTSLLSKLDTTQRSEVIEMMWQVAYADRHLDEIEEAIIRRVAGLLYVSHSEFIRTKLKVQQSISL